MPGAVFESVPITDGLIAFWNFQEVPAKPVAGTLAHAGSAQQGTLYSWGVAPVPVAGGLFGPQALEFGDEGMLFCPRSAADGLTIGGPDARVSVVAWLRRNPQLHGDRCEAVAGVWNEHGLRQYCLFVNLRIHGSAQQVCGHVSSSGGASPGERYAMDAAIGATPVSFDQWHTIAMSYDGGAARAYLDGRLDTRDGLNPYPHAGGLFDGGPNGADFTVGAVRRPDTVSEDFAEHGSVIGNFFQGVLGGLAVYSRALSSEEMRTLAAVGHQNFSM